MGIKKDASYYLPLVGKNTEIIRANTISIEELNSRVSDFIAIQSQWIMKADNQLDNLESRWEAQIQRNKAADQLFANRR